MDSLSDVIMMESFGWCWHEGIRVVDVFKVVGRERLIIDYGINENMDPHAMRIKMEEHELNLIRSKAGNVLEVCSGDGTNLLALRGIGLDVVGLEDPFFIEKEIDGVQHHKIFSRFPFEDSTFDVVYSYQYLNHNYKEKIVELFKEIYRVLKVGGLFSVKISDAEQYNLRHVSGDIYEEADSEHLQIQYKKLAENTFAKMSSKEKGIPHYAFQKDELVRCLEEIGFKLTDVRVIRWNIVGNFKKR